MTGTPIDERRFTDQEVREILKKAVEKGPSTSLTSHAGFSLAELKAIGTEVGIDPALLEDAARAVARGDGPPHNRIIGAPTVLNVERRVEGELDPSRTAEILALIRRTMGMQGEVSEVSGSLEWSAKGEAGERFVAVSSRDGTITIQASANITNAAIVTYLPTGVLAAIISMIGITQAAEAESLVGLVFFLSLLPAAYLALRALLRKVSGHESAKLERVVDELARFPFGSEDPTDPPDEAT